MVKLVGVLGGCDDKANGDGGRECLARRQFPLVIEPDLTMVMALDERCLACGVHSGHGDISHTGHRDTDKETFLRNYRSLSKDEVVASLMVTNVEVAGTLSGLVTCVGCRRSVETLYQTLSHSGDTALEPLVVTPDGVVAVNREHIEVETSLSNLFCHQVSRLSRDHIDTELRTRGNRRNMTRGGRCQLHSLDTRRHVTMSNWQETWHCMEQECREEVVLLPYTSIRHTLDNYLKKHSFCSECTNMVNRAYTLLVEEGQEPAKAAGEKPADSDPNVNSDGTVNLYCGISACSGPSDQHVHVKCDQDYIGQLLRLAEPELSGLRQERHAKTIEIAQKEVLTCIGLALFERFQKIQQKLKEAELTCDLLFLTLLKTLRRSLDMAAEKKRGLADLELLCQELEKCDKKKEGKRERKRNRRARKKELKNAVLAKISASDESKHGSDGESNSGDSGVSVDNKDHVIDDNKDHVIETQNNKIKSSASPEICSKFTKCTLTLEEMLEEDFEDDLDEDVDLIPAEEIKKFLDKSEDMAVRRQQLRDNLKMRFAQFCDNAVYSVRQ